MQAQIDASPDTAGVDRSSLSRPASRADGRNTAGGGTNTSINRSGSAPINRRGAAGAAVNRTGAAVNRGRPATGSPARSISRSQSDAVLSSILFRRRPYSAAEAETGPLLPGSISPHGIPGMIPYDGIATPGAAGYMSFNGKLPQGIPSMLPNDGIATPGAAGYMCFNGTPPYSGLATPALLPGPKTPHGRGMPRPASSAEFGSLLTVSMPPNGMLLTSGKRISRSASAVEVAMSPRGINTVGLTLGTEALGRSASMPAWQPTNIGGGHASTNTGGGNGPTGGGNTGGGNGLIGGGNTGGGNGPTGGENTGGGSRRPSSAEMLTSIEEAIGSMRSEAEEVR